MPRSSLIGPSVKAFGRAGYHCEPLLAQVDVALPSAAKSQPNQIVVAERLVPVGICDWLRSRTCGWRTAFSELGLARACRQSAGTDFPLSIWLTLQEKNSRDFPAGEPVAVLAAYSRNQKHRGRRSYFPTKKALSPPSVN